MTVWTPQLLGCMAWHGIACICHFGLIYLSTSIIGIMISLTDHLHLAVVQVAPSALHVAWLQ